MDSDLFEESRPCSEDVVYKNECICRERIREMCNSGQYDGKRQQRTGYNKSANWENCLDLSK